MTGCKVTAETSRDKSRHVTLPRPSAPSSGVPGRHELPPEVALQTQEGRQEPPRQVLVSSIISLLFLKTRPPSGSFQIQILGFGFRASHVLFYCPRSNPDSHFRHEKHSIYLNKTFYWIEIILISI